MFRGAETKGRLACKFAGTGGFEDEEFEKDILGNEDLPVPEVLKTRNWT